MFENYNYKLHTFLLLLPIKQVSKLDVNWPQDKYLKNRSFIWNIYGKSEAFEYFCPLSVHYLTQWSSFEYLWRVILEPDFTCCFLLVEIMLISSSHTGDINVTMCTDCRVFVVVFNATFYNISVISWRSLNGFQLQTSFTVWKFSKTSI